MIARSDKTVDAVALIYRDDLLGYSETFIADQAAALEHFRPVFVGMRVIHGLPLSCETFLLTSNHAATGLNRVRTKLFGPSPARLSQLQSMAPKVIHAHFLIDAMTACQIGAALRIPVLASVHGYDATISDLDLLRMGLAERAYLLRKRHILRQVHRFLCVSEYLKAQLLRKGFPQEKLAVHYTGIDTHFFTPDPSVQRTPNVLFVGRLVEKKGCEYLIKAMDIVQQRVPDVSLTVIGDGILRPKLEALANNKLRSFRFLGSQARESVRSFMNSATVFCVPSIVARSGDAEGFGMVFAEAQSMGLPVVSFATGGIPEAVQHERTGFLAPEKDHKQLASSIEALLLNRPLWQDLSANGMKRVRASFDLCEQTAKLEEIYLQAAENNPRGSQEPVSESVYA